MKEEQDEQRIKTGDVVSWCSQWAKRGHDGRMITYEGTVEESAIDKPGWFVRRKDGKRVKVRTAIMRKIK